MNNKTLSELWDELGKLRWWVVSFVIASIGVSFGAGKHYGEQNKVIELTVCQSQIQRQQSILLECRNIAGESLQKTIDAEMHFKEVRK